MVDIDFGESIIFLPFIYGGFPQILKLCSAVGFQLKEFCHSPNIRYNSSEKQAGTWTISCPWKCAW